jgi:hypothetical protein
MYPSLSPIFSLHVAHDVRCAGALGHWHAAWVPETKDRDTVTVLLEAVALSLLRSTKQQKGKDFLNKASRCAVRVSGWPEQFPWNVAVSSMTGMGTGSRQPEFSGRSGVRLQ